MPDPSKLYVEKHLAGAHRHLRAAMLKSSEWSNLGFHDDLQMFLLEIERMQEDLLKSRARRPPTAFNRA